MNRASALIETLSDGRFHSAQSLQRRHDLDRADFLHALEELDALGIEIEHTQAHGYRLTLATPPLVRDQILSQLNASSIESLELHAVLPSTNTRLLDAPPPRHGRARVCLAEIQTAGRGRRGRRWVAPFGSGICLSVAWLYAHPPEALGTLALASSVAALTVLRSFGLQALQLKWPNDLIVRGEKLGGVLVELRSDASGQTHVVAGIGLNVELSAPAREAIARESAYGVTDLAACGLQVDRNALAAALIGEMLSLLARFDTSGFAPYRKEWMAADALAEKTVSVHAGRDVHTGTAAGIDEDGALLLETATGKRRFVVGDVSLRAT